MTVSMGFFIIANIWLSRGIAKASYAPAFAVGIGIIYVIAAIFAG